MTETWQTLFISGGGSGIGLHFAERLARRGVPVAVFDLKISEAVRQKLSSTSPRTSFHEVDVRDADALARAVAQAAEAIGAPQLAVNCAGVQRARPFTELSAADFDFVVDINLKGSRNFASAMLPHMGPRGQLGFLASMAGLVSNFGYAAYSASKFGVIGLASALRIECGLNGIGVTVICPPEVETPMVEEERRTAPAVTLKAKQFAGSITLEQTADAMEAGFRRRQFLVVPGGRARLTYHLNRLLPGLSQRISDRMIRDLLGSTPQSET